MGDAVVVSAVVVLYVAVDVSDEVVAGVVAEDAGVVED